MDGVENFPSPKLSAQDDLAASIVAAWAELDAKAEAENPDEFCKAQAMFAAWGKKLDAMIKENQK